MPVVTKRWKTAGARLLSAIAWFAGVPAACADGIDIGARENGQLAVRIRPAQPFPLPTSPFPSFPGYVAADPGFGSLITPADGLSPPTSQSEVVFILDAVDPELSVWNDRGSAPMNPGESYYLGRPIFDVHVIWQIFPGEPGREYALTIHLHDLRHILTDSDPVTLRFTPVPEPATGLVCVLALALLRCRR